MNESKTLRMSRGKFLKFLYANPSHEIQFTGRVGLADAAQGKCNIAINSPLCRTVLFHTEQKTVMVPGGGKKATPHQQMKIVITSVTQTDVLRYCAGLSRMVKVLFPPDH